MATQIFNNEQELKTYFDSIMQQVIEAVSNDLLKDFQVHIKNTIYSAKPGEYVRYGGSDGLGEGGFGSGWVISEDISKATQQYVRSLIFDGNKLIAPQDDMINSQRSHGDGESGQDFRNIMMQILNDYYENSSYDYSYAGGAKYLTSPGQGYWDTYIIDIKNKCEKWFNKYLKQYGIRG